MHCSCPSLSLSLVSPVSGDFLIDETWKTACDFQDMPSLLLSPKCLMKREMLDAIQQKAAISGPSPSERRKRIRLEIDNRSARLVFIVRAPNSSRETIFTRARSASNRHRLSSSSSSIMQRPLSSLLKDLGVGGKQSKMTHSRH